VLLPVAWLVAESPTTPAIVAETCASEVTIVMAAKLRVGKIATDAPRASPNDKTILVDFNTVFL